MDNEIVKKILLELDKLTNIVHSIKDTELDNRKIDLEKIFLLGKKNRFSNHYIVELDDDLSYRYLTILASAVQLTQDEDHIYRQYYYISRVLANTDFNISNIIRDASTLSVADLDNFENGLSLNGKCYFLIDLLLLISNDGEIDNKQLDFFGEMASLVGFDNQKVKLVSEIVRDILQQDDTNILIKANEFDINFLKCFLAQDINGYISGTLNNVSNVNDDEIWVCGSEIKNIDDVIDIDLYEKKRIIFVGCTFSHVKGIRAHSTEVSFYRCNFNGCIDSRIGDEYDYMTEGASISSYRWKDNILQFCQFYLNHGKLVDCNFKDCNYANKCEVGVMLYVNDGTIENCSFDNCIVKASQTNTGYVASIIYAHYSKLVNNSFINCKVTGILHRFSSWDGTKYSASDKWYLHILRLINSTSEGTIIDQSECGVGYSYNRDECRKYNFLINSCDSENINFECKNCSSIGDYGEKIGWPSELQ